MLYVYIYKHDVFFLNINYIESVTSATFDNWFSGGHAHSLNCGGTTAAAKQLLGRVEALPCR